MPVPRLSPSSVTPRFRFFGDGGGGVAIRLTGMKFLSCTPPSLPPLPPPCRAAKGTHGLGGGFGDSLRHLGPSQGTHWPVLTYSEGRLSASHTLIPLKLCVVLLKLHKKKTPNPNEGGGMAASGSGEGRSGAGGCPGRAEWRGWGHSGAAGRGPGLAPSLSQLIPAPRVPVSPGAAQLGPVWPMEVQV